MREGSRPAVDPSALQGSQGAYGDRDCLDYDRVYHHLTSVWPAREHVELLERLAEELIQVCLDDARVEACRVVIRKLEVYPGTAMPEISVWRGREPTG